MKLQNTVLGQLAKASKGNAQVEDGDSLVTIPNLLLPGIFLPEPNANFFNAIPAAQSQSKSFMQSDNTVFNVGNSVVMNVLNSGLWYITWHHHVVVQGAVADSTSSVKFELGLIGPDFGGGGPVASLTFFSNIQNIFQHARGEFWIHLPKEQQLQFIKTTIAGLGTGLNLSRIFFCCQKMA
jgi:hypothetical protein